MKHNGARDERLGVIRLGYSTGMKMEIHREAELILNKYTCASAGWPIEGMMGYVGAPKRHLQHIKVHGTPQQMWNIIATCHWYYLL